MRYYYKMLQNEQLFFATYFSYFNIDRIPVQFVSLKNTEEGENVANDADRLL